MDFREVLRHNEELAAGDEVIVRWTNSHNYYQGRGTVVRVNAASVRVALSEPVPTGYSEPYPVGREISVPRCAFRSIERWSWNNGVFPVSEGR